jgi:hypothetical protein
VFLTCKAANVLPDATKQTGGWVCILTVPHEAKLCSIEL